MNLERQAQLKRMFDAGYTIQIETSYVDTPVNDISWSEEDKSYVFSSQVYSNAPLKGIPQFQVSIYQPQTWEEVNKELDGDGWEMPDDHLSQT